MSIIALRNPVFNQVIVSKHVDNHYGYDYELLVKHVKNNLSKYLKVEKVEGGVFGERGVVYIIKGKRYMIANSRVLCLDNNKAYQLLTFIADQNGCRSASEFIKKNNLQTMVRSK